MKFVAPKAYLEQVQRTPGSAHTRQALELMDRNERTVDFPPEVIAELRGLLTPFLLRAYPEPAALYEKLVSWLKLPREMILLTMGADGGLRSIFDVFVEPQDHVVSLTPSYAMYPVYCGIAGAIAEEVRFNDDLSLHLDQILERINEHTKAVVVANPNQPIERVYDETELRTLVETCARHGALLVVDEAYYHFCPMTALPLLRDYGNLVIVRTFSKAFGIAGIRLGYLLSQPRNIAYLNKVRPMYEAHAPAIAIGCYLLDHEELMRSYVAAVQEARGLLAEGLQPLGLRAIGRCSNSVLVPLPEDLPARQIADALKARGFLIRAETQAPLSNHLRITVGQKAQVTRFLDALQEVVAVRHSARLTPTGRG